MRVNAMQVNRVKIGSAGGRISLLLGVSALALLAAGCSGGPPPDPNATRPGAEQKAATAGLPSANASRQYETGVAAVDETRGGTKIGSVVGDKGGQKAQLDAAAKEAAEVDAKERAEADRQAAERKSADAAAAESDKSHAANAASEPATQAAVPPPASVTTTPVQPATGAPTTSPASPPPASPNAPLPPRQSSAAPDPASAVVRVVAASGRAEVLLDL
jgi:hypothetical protein